MNKRGFKTSDWIIATIIFSGIIALGVIAVNDLATQYDNTDIIDSDFSDKFDKFENNTAIAADAFSEASGEGGLTLIGSFDVLFNSAFTIIALVFSSLSIVGSQAFGFTEFFGIPSTVAKIFFTLILSILTTIILFLVINSVTRRDI